MIYSQIPLKCKFIPINTDHEVFQTVFMFHFPFYLENVANKYMQLVDEPETQNLKEGDVVHLARWAKDVYENRVSIETVMSNYKYEVYCDKHLKYIIDTIKPNQIGFKFGDSSQHNVNEAIRLYNEIGNKIFC